MPPNEDPRPLHKRAQAILQLGAAQAPLSDPAAEKIFLDSVLNIAEATNPDGTVNLDSLTPENRKSFLAAWSRHSRRQQGKNQSKTDKGSSND